MKRTNQDTRESGNRMANPPLRAYRREEQVQGEAL